MRIWYPATPVEKILVITILNPKHLAVARELREACRLIGGTTSTLAHHINLSICLFRYSVNTNPIDKAPPLIHVNSSPSVWCACNVG